MNLEESENHCSKAKKKEVDGWKRQELLVADVEFLKNELATYKAGEEGHLVTKKKLFLKSPKFFKLLGSRSTPLRPRL